MKMITTKTLKMTSEEWGGLIGFTEDFEEICNTTSCIECPFDKFCDNNTKTPAQYFRDLYKFIEVNC